MDENKLKCCYIECDAEVTHEIVFGREATDVVQACVEHTEVLTPDGNAQVHQLLVGDQVENGC